MHIMHNSHITQDLCTKEVAEDQSSRYSVLSYPGWRLLAEDGQHLVLFKIHTKIDTGIQAHECAFFSVLEKYKGPNKAGHLSRILHILHSLHILPILHIGSISYNLIYIYTV
jgi:hypothetical protein